MGKRGQGYGSEGHFLRYRATQPEALDRLLLNSLNSPDGRLEWHYPKNIEAEKEPQGLDFLDPGSEARALCRAY